MIRLSSISSSDRARFLFLEVPADVRRLLVGYGLAAAEATGGEGDDADHLTLCFVPKADRPIPGAEVDAVLGLLEEALSSFHPFEVWIGGIAYFDTAEKDGEKRTALVALVDGPGLTVLHEIVRDALRDFGWEWEPNHVFNPHVTLAYLPVGARVGGIPSLDAVWAVDGICFSNVEVHRIPFGGTRKEGVLSEEQIYTAIGEASMCWEHPEGAGVFQSGRALEIGDRLYREQFEKEADLSSADLKRFRTTPDSGKGLLYSYCSDCAHLARGADIWGCSKGDDADVLDYSDRLDRGETSEAVERCPLYTPTDEEQKTDETIRQARLLRADLQPEEVPQDLAVVERSAEEVPPPHPVFGPEEERFFIWKSGTDPCEMCAPFVGNVYGVSEKLPHGMPPIHARCECFVEPIGWLEARRILFAKEMQRQEAGMVKEVPGEVSNRSLDEEVELDAWGFPDRHEG